MAGGAARLELAADEHRHLVGEYRHAVLIEQFELPVVGDVGAVPRHLDQQRQRHRLGLGTDLSQPTTQDEELSLGDLGGVGEKHGDLGERGLEVGEVAHDSHLTRTVSAVRTAAVVLAAGGGSRFAGPGHKLLAELRGRPVVAWSVGAASAAQLDETIVVEGAISLASQFPAGVTLLPNPHWAQGLATSLGVAVRYAIERGYDAIVVGLGDQPGVTPEAWRSIAAAIDAPIAVACYHGHRGHPVRLAASVFASLPQSGDVGARDLIRLRPDLVCEIPCDGEPGDIDRVEDLGKWS